MIALLLLATSPPGSWLLITRHLGVLIACFSGSLSAADHDRHQFMHFGKQAFHVNARFHLAIDHQLKPIGGQIEIIEGRIEPFQIGRQFSATHRGTVERPGSSQGAQHPLAQDGSLVTVRQTLVEFDGMQGCRFGTGTQIGLVQTHRHSPMSLWQI